MRAIVIQKPGGPEVLELREVDTPTPSRVEVRVRVRATAVNRADVLQRMGRYPAPADAPADIPGLELAGEVDALGPGVSELSVGDRVFGLVGGGAYAEHVVAHARTLARIPSRLSFTDAAAVPEAFVTAYDAMVVQGRLTAGERVLVHAAGSGVGTAAIQIARAIGAHPVGTVRTAEKVDKARALGLADALVVADGKFAAQVLARWPAGVEVVLELVGGSYVAEDLEAVATRGRIVVVGTMAGVTASVDLGLLLRKRIELRGTVLRARPLEEKILAGQLLARQIAPLVAEGKLLPVVDQVLPLARAAEAHERMQANDSFGKIVLEV